MWKANLQALNVGGDEAVENTQEGLWFVTKTRLLLGCHRLVFPGKLTSGQWIVSLSRLGMAMVAVTRVAATIPHLGLEASVLVAASLR